MSSALAPANRGDAPANSKQGKGAAANDKKEPGLSGALKAAIWILSVEDEVAVDVLSRLDDSQLKRLRFAVPALNKVSPEELAQVHADFQKTMADTPLQLRGSSDYLKKLAVRAFGVERVAKIFGEQGTIELPPTLGQAEPEVLSGILAREHPQVAAAVLASLPSPHNSEVLKRFPEGIRAEIITRLAQLQKVPHRALRNVEEILAAGLPTSAEDDLTVDGTRVAATLLNKLGGDVADKILEVVNNGLPDVAANIRRAMFTFEDLGRLDRKSFQALLKEVPNEQLLIALKTASESMREKIFGSLSKRAAEMLRDDLELLGPQRLADVEAAQTTIVGVAMQLRNDGKITLPNEGGAGYV